MTLQHDYSSASYLERFDQTPDDKKWEVVREWMFKETSPFARELREYRPILETPMGVLVSRLSDCREVLLRHDTFTVDLYKPKQGDYWMAQDDTPQHQREKSIMYSVMDRETVPSIRQFVAQEAERLLKEAGGSMNAVNDLARAVPIAVVQNCFGYTDAPAEKLQEWSYWNQADAFHNQPMDAPAVPDQDAVTAMRKKVSDEELRPYIIQLLQKRGAELKAGQKNDDIVSRLLTLSASGALNFDIPAVALNVGGLLIGTIETTSQAVVHALAQLIQRPEVLAKARNAANACDTQAFDGYVFEALRFHPISPYMFRVSNKETLLAKGTVYETRIPKGTIVMPFVHSAMFDSAAYANPDAFDPTRSTENTFHFGLGLHECLGKAIGYAMVAEIVRQCVLLPDLQENSPISYEGKLLPEKYEISWKA